MEDTKFRNSDELTTSERRRVMDLAYDAGSILLENGDEISNVEETMMRIARHFGIDDENFFVLSNGIMATERNYARTKYIPIQGTCLEKVVEVKQLVARKALGQDAVGNLLAGDVAQQIAFVGIVARIQVELPLSASVGAEDHLPVVISESGGEVGELVVGELFNGVREQVVDVDVGFSETGGGQYDLAVFMGVGKRCNFLEFK